MTEKMDKKEGFNNTDDKSWMIGFLKKRGYVFGTVKLSESTVELTPSQKMDTINDKEVNR